MNKARLAGIAALFCMVASTGIALAENHTITWKNQLGASSCTPLEIKITNVTGGGITNRDTVPLLLNQTRATTVNSTTCQRIDLTAGCTYSDKNLSKHISLHAVAPCENSTAKIIYPGRIILTTP